jgi:hypothetical protein
MTPAESETQKENQIIVLNKELEGFKNEIKFGEDKKQSFVQAYAKKEAIKFHQPVQVARKRAQDLWDALPKKLQDEWQDFDKLNTSYEEANQILKESKELGAEEIRMILKLSK